MQIVYTNLTDILNEFDLFFKNNKKIKPLDDILKRYNGTDWKNYVQYDDNTYKKNLVKRTSEYELYVVCWKDNQGTVCHDHAGNGCLFKILDGELVETIYTDSDSDSGKNSKKLIINDIGYIDNTIGYHTMHNKCNNTSVSLHLYSPPNYKMNVVKILDSF